MSNILLILLFLTISIELLIAFVIYPLKNGVNFYKLVSGGRFKVFKYDKILGYDWNINLDYKNPTIPLKEAPRKIQWVDIKTDKYGFLTKKNIDEVKEKSKLIFCIGGSTTAGGESRHDFSYPNILSSMTESLGYTVINAGVGGYRSIHELLFFKKKVLKHKPHSVIIFSGYNDFEDAAWNLSNPFDPHTHCLSQNLPNNYIEVYLQKSALYFTTKRFIYFLRKKIRSENIPKFSIRNFKKVLENPLFLDEWSVNMSSLIEECKKNNVKVYMLSHASPCFKEASNEEKNFADIDLNMQGLFDIFLKYIEIIEERTKYLCKSLNVKYLDINESFNLPYKNRYLMFVDRMHYSEEGNKLLANAIFSELFSDLKKNH